MKLEPHSGVGKRKRKKTIHETATVTTMNVTKPGMLSGMSPRVGIGQCWPILKSVAAFEFGGGPISAILQFEPFSGLVANMQTHAEYLRAEAEKCERQAKKAGSATAMFTLLDLAEDLRRKAAQAEMEDKDSKQE
jgi:hypothetical protein